MRRALIFPAAILSVAAVGMTAAAAAWSASAQGTATVKSTTLTQGAMSTVTADGTTSLQMNLVWAVTGVTAASPAVNADGYHIRRYSVASGGTATDACGSTASARITGTSCSDTAANTNPVWYTVTPHYLTWSGPESARVQGTPTTISTSKLVITSAAVSGSTSATPNLGLITVQRQNGSGTPLTATTALTVNLTSSSAGGKFSVGTGQQFNTSTVTSISIAANASSATFWYGDSTAGTPTLTAAAASFTSATQAETITTAPAGLAITQTAGGGTLTCGSISTSYACTFTGIANNSGVSFTVKFVNASGTAMVYSATQSSALTMSGFSTGTATVAANATTSAGTMTASRSGSNKTSTITFGPYSLTINVNS